MTDFHVPQFRVEPLAQPELRKDPVIDRWVVIATDRLGRPQEYAEEAPPQVLAACPFCAGNEHLTPPATYTYPPTGQWRVRVVPNTYPAVRGLGAFQPAGEMFCGAAAPGVHEVVVASPQHETSLARLPAAHLAELFGAFRQRMGDLKHERPGLYPLIFNNHRAAAGASLEHVHAQIIAVPLVPDLVRRELAASAEHHARTGRCIYCDLLARELVDGMRIVQETPHFVALSAYAARFPCELWLLPRAHASHFEELSDAELSDLGAVMSLLLQKLDRGLNDPAYNLILHTAPPAGPSLAGYHWHLEILPRLTGTAGFEWGTGMNINPVPPEQAAAYLRLIPKDEKDQRD